MLHWIGNPETLDDFRMIVEVVVLVQVGRLNFPVEEHHLEVERKCCEESCLLPLLVARLVSEAFEVVLY